MIENYFDWVREPSFDSLKSDSIESYRLRIASTRWPEFLVRIWRQSDQPPCVVAHRQSYSGGTGWSSDTYQANLELKLWHGFQVVLDVAEFWRLPEHGPGSAVLGASNYYLEGLKNGQVHTVAREAPRMGQMGELFLLPCDYLSRLGELVEHMSQS